MYMRLRVHVHHAVVKQSPAMVRPLTAVSLPLAVSCERSVSLLTGETEAPPLPTLSHCGCLSIQRVTTIMCRWKQESGLGEGNEPPPPTHVAFVLIQVISYLKAL